MGKDTTRLTTTARSLEIFEAVQQMDGARMADLTENMDLSQSAIHKHLSTLVDNGYLVKEGEIYNVGLKVFHIGEYARYRKRGFKFAEQKVSYLSGRINNNANFSVLEHGRNVVVFSSENDRTSEGFQAGRFDYAHSSAAGKALLADLSDEEVHEILDRWGLPAVTPNTITSREALLNELAEIRKQGYAVNNGEAIEGLKAVAVTVDEPGGKTFGALDISAPMYRFPDNDDFINLLTNLADELEEELDAVDLY